MLNEVKHLRAKLYIAIWAFEKVRFFACFGAYELSYKFLKDGQRVSRRLPFG
jgi:hypothetical protein